MAFQQGLSGLAASSKALDVIGNNVANASTVGFKAANAHFADVYANALNGGGAMQVGIGTSLAAVVQQFTQGNITTTNNPLDISINGNGFFRMSQNGAITYTRNGQFHLDNSNFIVNDQNYKLTGYLADASGNIAATTPQEIQISATDLAPVATGASTGTGFKGVQAVVNLDSRSLVPSTAWAPTVSPGPAGLATVNATSYTYSTPAQIYDSLGNAHTMTYYFLQTATPGQWQVYANVDGTQFSNVNLGAGAGNPITLNFDTNGKLTTAMPITGVSVNLAGITADLTAAGVNKPNGATTPLVFGLDFTGTTQFGSTSGTNTVTSDGYSSGRLVGLSVGSDGIVQGRYSNGQARNLAQVVMANFQNPNGLTSLGNNQWAQTSASGQPAIGTPNTGSMGVLQSNSIEESNVDLTGELVAMITQQRNYQANAQTIKTQDSIMNTLVNLR
ncbi:flagellar hook protein FlgE [Oryzomicrobium sp.]|uniref:flagellar hook protein FlgE n=1 Tax=Oryzomicrobium sp. TaxID=1911578 RepID=UPI0025F52194|nr:flagellar hook protein FlgE [Oryzomicrobium sp.]MCE1241871.1 flagellar hook protein FlgE [Oryzomicrobium sp.]